MTLCMYKGSYNNNSLCVVSTCRDPACEIILRYTSTPLAKWNGQELVSICVVSNRNRREGRRSWGRKDGKDVSSFSVSAAGLDRRWGEVLLCHYFTDSTRECRCVPLCVHWSCSFFSCEDTVQKTVSSCLFSTGGLPSAVYCSGRRRWVGDHGVAVSVNSYTSRGGGVLNGPLLGRHS